jgi:hypothetical protein
MKSVHARWPHRARGRPTASARQGATPDLQCAVGGDWELIVFGGWMVLVVCRLRRGNFFKWNSGFDNLEAFANQPGDRKTARTIATLEAEETAPPTKPSPTAPRDP